MQEESQPGPERRDELPAVATVPWSPSPAHRIFLDESGMRLRPVWRVLLFFIIYRAFYWLFGDVVLVVVHNYLHLSALWLSMFAEGGVLVAVAIATVIMAAIEARPPGDYGLPLRNAFGRLFWLGTMWGVASLTFLMLLLHGVGVVDFGNVALSGARIFKFAAFWGVFFLLVAFYEELLSRGYALFTLTQSIGFWPSALLFSAGFGLLHLGNLGESKIGIAAAAVIGLFFCLTVRRTGTLWFAIGFHTSWDWGETYFYSVPDSGQILPGHLLNSAFHGPTWLSGGSVGPEGSALVFVVVAVTWVVFDRAYPVANYPRLARSPEPSTSAGV